MNLKSLENKLEVLEKDNEHLLALISTSSQSQLKTLEKNNEAILRIIEANSEQLSGLINAVSADLNDRLSDQNDLVLNMFLNQRVALEKDNEHLLALISTSSQSQLKTLEKNNEAILRIIEANSEQLSGLINAVSADLNDRLSDQNDLVLNMFLNQRVALHAADKARPPENFTMICPDSDYSYEKSLDLLKHTAPDNFDEYMRCFEEGAASYQDLPAQSCSTALHAEAALFAKFLLPYLRGRVLDIGCGPQAIPSYLSGYPVELIAGIDPLPPAGRHPFMFVRGFAEFLPWPDNSFECLVFGTTIDHYYLLDKGICEARRVLSANGFVCIWITEFDDGAQIDPYKPVLKSYDHEHLYHINRRWFIPFMEKHGFEHLETFAFNSPFKYIFLSFRKAS